MKNIFKSYLFTKHILVAEENDSYDNSVEAVISMGHYLGIHITQNPDLCSLDMLKFAQEEMGENIPMPFYKGFPESVKSLSNDELIMDQLIHYLRTYGFSDFSAPGHSIFEEQFNRIAFAEKTEIKEFAILKEEEALKKLYEIENDMLSTTRPLNSYDYSILLETIKTYGFKPEKCASKNTAVKLLVDLNDVYFARFLDITDTIKVLDYILDNFYPFSEKNKYSLRNKHRAILSQTIDHFFKQGNVNDFGCYEKRKRWNGLLHHIHYVPVNEEAEKFVSSIKTGHTKSALSFFEEKMNNNDPVSAAKYLSKGKGTGGLLRNINYIISRCSTTEEVKEVIEQIKNPSPLMLAQLYIQYNEYDTEAKRRTFKFLHNGTLNIHKESENEQTHRKSLLDNDTVEMLKEVILDKFLKELEGKNSKITYIDPDMANIAMPLQDSTSSGGFGAMPRGSKLMIPSDKKIRAFVYWEKVYDIDLSVISIDEDMKRKEFSWRTMSWASNKERSAITYSGDETSGFNGGSEYFDINMNLFREAFPDARYLIFNANIYSDETFNNIYCTAGYMERDVEDSGEIYEPKTVKTSFAINANSTYANLFAIDLKTSELIWLNVAVDSHSHIAGETDVTYCKPYLTITDFINVKNVMEAMTAPELLTDDPAEADLIISDKSFEEIKEGASQIHSYDTSSLLKMLEKAE